jgi:threonylcarbamoyladenosine tRNA methylthiotransferase MtaB
VAAGYREIVLTGVNVGDYGRKEGTDLPDLLRALVRIPGLDRLRISSIEPNLLSDEILELVAGNGTLCRHFHVPLQSGSDPILRAMRRRYTTAQYAERIEAIRRLIPDAGIGVDVIVGFPGESEADFAATHRFLESLPVSYLHIFTYSERPNTPAASRPKRVEPALRFRRSAILRQLGEKKRREFHASSLGRTLPVLLESDEGNGCRCGYSDTYVRVAVPAESAQANTLVDVLVTGVDSKGCSGRVLGENRR